MRGRHRESGDHNGGSLFPSLHRMEERGWGEAEWRPSQNNRPANYYRLTSSGRAQLKIVERDWKHLVKTTTAAVETA
ncbi:MAG TPA: helix-turn-helix transcriptional regulator [Verrucomicrobiae bacterium]|nr:helix-turn-helix transcriptional regulator [Verrucomicrobiae bacterium]